MFKPFVDLIASQYEAAFLTVQECIESCPDNAWDQPVCNHRFCQSAFHALFFADVYLGANPEAVEDQDFHREHAETFAGYDQWEKEHTDKHYSKEFVAAYLQHCRDKAKTLLENVTEAELTAPSGFFWIGGPAAEVHVYNIRHLQHHAAQLSLRLRLDSLAEISWQKGVWPKAADTV